jgi:hypothetical protein
MSRERALKVVLVVVGLLFTTGFCPLVGPTLGLEIAGQRVGFLAGSAVLVSSV